MPPIRRAFLTGGLILLLASAGWTVQTKSGSGEAGFATAVQKIQHIIVIYQENWSFDGLYGKFPGGYGLSSPAARITQVDKDGNPLIELPQPLDTETSPSTPDKRFPPANGSPELPPLPFDMTKYVGADQTAGDLVHKFYHEQLQIDAGKMDKFVTWSDNGGLVLSYLDATNLPEGKLAQEFVLCDDSFHSAFGGSFLNHQFLIAAAPPVWKNAPATAISSPDPRNLRDAIVTPDGFAVNTVFSVNSPHPSDSDPAMLLPEQTNPTIGDRLSEKTISWKWYSGGWNTAIAGFPDPLFQFHHQPFAYYENFKDGTPARNEHLQDESAFLTDLILGNLPAVSFIKPLGEDNEHPGYATVLRGQQHVQQIVDAVRQSDYWKDSVIIVTYDENGGRWDHVAPPVIDRWGPGTRVPTIVISPFAKRHFVDHTTYETVSILKLIETRYGLAPLSDRDAKANPFSNAFDFANGETNAGANH